jgi:hypothetical protein
MKEGAVLCTLSPLRSAVGCGLADANATRKRSKKSESENASFFELEEVPLGQANCSVSWSEGGSCYDMIKVYKYTRTRQSSGGKSVFLCSNFSECEKARGAVPIDAVRYDEDGSPYVAEACDECGIWRKTFRSRR